MKKILFIVLLGFLYITSFGQYITQRPNVSHAVGILPIVNGGTGTSLSIGSGENDYFTTQASLLEPLAYMPVKTGTFTCTFSNSTKYLMASFFTKIGSTGRIEVRNLFKPLPLRMTTLNGVEVLKSTACIIDPSLCSFTYAKKSYYDKLVMIDTLKTKTVDFTAAVQTKPFLPGPYGSIITNITFHDLTWIAALCNGGGWNLWNEIDDLYIFRNGTSYNFPVSKLMVHSLISGNGPDGVHQSVFPSQPSMGTVSYVILPSTYGNVTDNTSYIFRDDFMETTLDLTNKWNRVQSGSTMIIDTSFAWLKCTGSAAWNANTVFSKTSTSRVAGKIFIADVYIDKSTGAQPRGVIGWHDGSGYDYSDFTHGINFANTSITIFENGNICTTGATYTNNCSYRIKITLGSSGATYQIQGGTEYPAVGDTTWTTLTPAGSTNPTTTPLSIGVSMFEKTMWVGDVKIY